MFNAIRRSLYALAAAGIVAVFLRVRGGNDNTPRHEGGWRELSGPNFN